MNKIEICRWMEYTELETSVSVLIAVIFEQICSFQILRGR